MSRSRCSGFLVSGAGSAQQLVADGEGEPVLAAGELDVQEIGAHGQRGSHQTVQRHHGQVVVHSSSPR